MRFSDCGCFPNGESAGAEPPLSGKTGGGSQCVMLAVSDACIATTVPDNIFGDNQMMA